MDEPLPPLPDPLPHKILRFRALFMEEAADLLQQAERCLQLSRDGAAPEDLADNLFRGIHTIKSGAASFGMPRTVAFAHVFESVLQELRNGRYQLDATRLPIFFRCYDMLAALLQAETGAAVLATDAETELIKTMECFPGLSIVLRDSGSITTKQTRSVPLLRIGAGTTIRVELAKIDRLFNLASDLIILEGMLRQQASLLVNAKGAGADAFMQGLDELSQYLRDLYDATMNARAQPLSTVFQQLPRLVRDLADRLGKQVNLTINGSDTEVDKTIIEQLTAPLTHLLRNAVDHGIEHPGMRQQASKQSAGQICVMRGASITTCASRLRMMGAALI